ncbi:SMP-30/gluconolactonase/LRE family protein [Parvularcula maris]|uniref:SMP-30/gluconolactonase/LRE family protein n=1 Tax=Parvularcula maris TaxID=2965077 RepID=A0A9X2RI74_9PROT|nr:SMP-30/gluconolactonase/LRE family protein [Parvularcula maris]MCQ8184651.1 SMP-30/gluconolactonase/LRE family protein [Parvularcula maris]
MSRFADLYQTRQSVLVGACTEFALVPGAEDMVSVSGGVFLSSVDRRGFEDGWRPGIYWWPDGGEIELASLDAPDDFKPHGLSLWEGPDETILYAISHPGGLYSEAESGPSHTVEVFAVSEGRLSHRRTLTHPLFRSPNDLAVFAEDGFYITNDKRWIGGLRGAMETYLLLPVADVVRFERGSARIVADGLNYANGIALSEDRGTLYVNEVQGRRMRAYDVGENGDLAERTRFSMGSAPDNVTIAKGGSLISAGISDAFRFEAFRDEKADDAPSLILRVDPKSGEKETLFYDDSGQISGATVGLQHGSELLIGTAYGRHVARCPYPAG